MSRIVSKVVTRYYVDGKGYANRHTAARKIAKMRLRDKVGPLVGPLRNISFEDRDDETKRLAYKQAWRDAYNIVLMTEFGLTAPGPNRGAQKVLYDHWIEAEIQKILAENPKP